MTSPKAPPMSTSPMSSCMLLSMVRSSSDLDVDDLLHPHEAHDHGDDGPAEQDVAEGVGEELRRVVGVDDEHGEAESYGEQAEDDRAHATFSREGGDVTAEPLALGHGVGHREEQLGEVATDLPLDADGH